MKKPGQIVLFEFPQANLEKGKPRPALLISQLPGEYDDWLICMISSQIHQYIPDFDEIIQENDPDFIESGLRIPSVIRISRLAVIEGEILIGAIGQIFHDRLQRIKANIANWIIKS